MNANGVMWHDKDWAWSDEHIRQVCSWLIKDPRSPFYNQMRLLLRTAKFPDVIDKKLKVALLSADQPLYLWMSYRKTVTGYLKKIIAGQRSMRILKRDKNGRILKWEVVKPLDPVPLPIPPFIKGVIDFGKGVPRMLINQTNVYKPPRGDRSRLMNPFGV